VVLSPTRVMAGAVNVVIVDIQPIVPYNTIHHSGGHSIKLLVAFAAAWLMACTLHRGHMWVVVKGSRFHGHRPKGTALWACLEREPGKGSPSSGLKNSTGCM